MTDDVTRRRFFRRVTDEALSTAVSFAGVAGELQRASVEMAGLVERDEDAPPTEAPSTASAPGPTSGTAPYREESGRLLIPDLRPTAAAGTVRSCGTAVEVARAMREGLVRGAPVASGLAALALALTAVQVREIRPWMRRAALRDAAAALSDARVSSAELSSTIARVLEAWQGLGDLHPDGDEVAVAVRAEAEAAIADGIDARRAMAQTAAAEIAGSGDRGTLRILLHGETGTRAAPPSGTALAVLEAIARTGRPLRVWLAVVSPWMRGPGSVEADLVALGIPHRAVDVEAVGGLVRSGEVDALLLATECVAANGDLAAEPGAYPLAVLADRHRVPVIVCGTSVTIAVDLADGGAIPTGAATPGDRPLVDIIDGALVTSLITEVGPWPRRTPTPVSGGAGC